MRHPGRALPGLGLGLMLALLLALPAAAGRPPAEQYRLHCSGCHGADGAGVPGWIPSLRGLAHLAGLPGGRAYLARVPGVAQAPVSDAELAGLLDWVLRELSPGPPPAPYSAREVGELRRRPLRDPASARPR